MKKMNRWIGLLLAICLTVSLLPGYAHAEQMQVYSETVYPEDYEGPVQVGFGYEMLESEKYLSGGYLNSIDEAAAALRDGLKKREPQVQVKFKAPSTMTYKEAGKAVWNEAMVHTGVPTEGDYLFKQWGPMTYSAGYYTDGDVTYFDITYHVTYYTTAQQEQAVDAAVEALLAELDLDGKSDYEKISAVYLWMCSNIVYDYENLPDPEYTLKYTAYAALIDRTSVCQGYALLFYRLMLELGIDCRLITGFGNGGGHAWNIVKLDGKYYNVDATWDASWYMSLGRYEYFLRCDANFGDHVRNEEFDTAAFRALYPMSNVDYDTGAVKHDYVATVTPPTCTEQGYTTYICSVCGDGYLYDFVDPTGHTPGEPVKEKETAEGYEQVVYCATCGQELSREQIHHNPEEEEPDFYICLHTCMVCGMCTSEELLACNSRYGERTSQCSCVVPLPVIESAGAENAQIVESNTWCGEVTARVETFDLESVDTELVFNSEYFQTIFSSIGSMDVEALYDITLYDEYGNACTINKKGGTEESVTLTIPVSDEIVEIATTGELELYHVDRNGDVKAVDFTVDAANDTLTFTGYSFSPYALVQEPSLYGRNLLKDMPNSQALVSAYDQIAEAVENTTEQVNLYDDQNRISVEELQLVMDLYRRDNAGAFWLGNEWGYSTMDDAVYDVYLNYLMTGAELEMARAAFEFRVSILLSELDPAMSEYEKVLYLHDELASRITYDLNAPNAYDAYGALVDGRSVCEGYAEALQYLAQRAGMQGFLAIGSSINPGTGTGEPHEWNYIRMDGKYYHVDLTWDDQSDGVYHAYFGLSDAMIQEDHYIEPVSYDLPVCDSTDAFYFEGKPEKLDTYTVASVAALLKDKNDEVRVYIPGDVQEFLDWFGWNIFEIAAEMGLHNGFIYSYRWLGREVVLFVASSFGGWSVSGTVNSFGGDTDPVIVELYAGDILVDQITENTGSYCFENVEDGTYIVRVTKEGHHAEEITVVVSGADVVQNVQLCLSGDINGDGKLNNKDATRLFQHLSGWNVEVIEELLDVNGDGKVNNKDATRLFQYLSGWDVEIY